jgi:pimeloyl-ACP methyl ester carboxylesterase
MRLQCQAPPARRRSTPLLPGRGRSAAALLVPFLVLAISGCAARTPPIKGPDGRPLPGSIAELRAVPIGGMEQWVRIRGWDQESPILLWLHGGPGSSDMPVTRRFVGEMEEHFVVVSWDQRGAGKSNPRDFDEGTMSFQQFLKDGHEVTRYLKERFGRDRIFLLGHSWGSQLGLRLAQRHPEDYYAYVGVAQSVDQARSQVLAREWLKERLEASGKTKDLRKLESLGPAPYACHGDYVTFARMIGAEGGNMDVGFVRLAWAALRAPEYTLRDLRSWLRGSNRGSGPMWDAPDYQGFNAFQQIPTLEVPVYFLMGRRDRNTPLELVEEYARGLEAPAKEIVVFERSAHTPFLGEPERFSRELLRVKEEALGRR